jgi:hypothetical protein
MIFPDDYKLIGIKDKEELWNPIYYATNYLIIRQGPKLYSIKSRGQGFMNKTHDFRLIAEGNQIFEYPEKVDTRDRSLLIRLAYRICQNGVNTVIFQGPDEHITFVHNPDPNQILYIEILDVSPPDPPWLVQAIEKSLSSGILGDLTIDFKSKIFDLRNFQCDCAYFPCKAAGLGLSLDSDKVIHNHPLIIGCEISRKIFLEINPNKDHDFINMCPLDNIEISGPFITRCCRSERCGLTTRNGHKGIVVHWGDSPWKIAEAIRTLVQILRG